MRSSVLPLLGLLFVVAACGDGRLKNLSVGIDRDSVGVVMKTDAPTRSETYLVGGKLWEVLLYERKAGAATDSTSARELSPVVLADGHVAGWGWDYWERQASQLKVPVVPGK
jgi:hypothetical protein